MKICLYFLLNLAIAVGTSTKHVHLDATPVHDSGTCPLWTTSGPNNTCKCGSSLHGIVQCSDDQKIVTLPFCYCMSRYPSSDGYFNTAVVGYCIKRCYISVHDPVRYGTFGYGRYKILVNNTFSNDSEKTNHALCSDLNISRTGLMCGSCVEDFAPPVYSYSSECVNCSNYSLNWLKYIAIAYLPLTVFYLLVILFRISATSPRLHGYITTCQILTSPNLLRWFSVQVFDFAGEVYIAKVGLKGLCAFYSIWNLDFFRPMYTPFCVHPKMSTVQTFALDYAVALYPLLLTVLTYTLVTLHDRYIVILWMWRPFYKCFRFFRKEWDLRTSPVSAFATFILLSYVKILNTSLDLLTPSILYDMNGNTIKQRYLSIDGTVEFFGSQHWPYALLALFMCSVFNILPLVLLCLYPCRCFHRCLNRFKLHSQTVHTFIEVFQGCFKTHPRDYRHFAVFYILLRIVNVFISSFAPGSLYLVLAATVMLFNTIAVAVVKPYKSSMANAIDIFLFSAAAIGFYSQPAWQYIFLTSWKVYETVLDILLCILFTCHFLFGVGILILPFQPKKLKTFCLSIFERITQPKAETSPSEESWLLPDQVQCNPEHAPSTTTVDVQNRINYTCGPVNS